MSANKLVDIIIEFVRKSNIHLPDLVNTHDGYYTQLHKASSEGNQAMCKILLGYGADVSLRNKHNRWTALHHAAFNGEQECLNLLLKYADGKCVNKKDIYGDTALHLSAFNGQQICTWLLLGAEATVDVFNVEGKTPLHDAAENGHHECVILLLANGADVHCRVKRKNNSKWHDFNKTPYDLAQKSGHKQTAEFLEKAMLHQRIKENKVSHIRTKTAEVVSDQNQTTDFNSRLAALERRFEEEVNLLKERIYNLETQTSHKSSYNMTAPKAVYQRRQELSETDRISKSLVKTYEFAMDHLSLNIRPQLLSQGLISIRLSQEIRRKEEYKDTSSACEILLEELCRKINNEDLFCTFLTILAESKQTVLKVNYQSNYQSLGGISDKIVKI